MFDIPFATYCYMKKMYAFPSPPVCTDRWDALAWIIYIRNRGVFWNLDARRREFNQLIIDIVGDKYE